MAANHREAKSGTSGDGFGGQELNTFAPSVNEMRVYRENKDTHGNPQFILLEPRDDCETQRGLRRQPLLPAL